MGIENPTASGESPSREVEREHEGEMEVSGENVRANASKTGREVSREL